MYQSLIEQLKGKKIAIWGFGKEGKSTYRFIRRHLPEVPLWLLDNNEDVVNQNPELKEDLNLTIVIGEKLFNDLPTYDLIIKSPGVRLVGRDTSLYQDKITSQIGLILEMTDLFVIGVTASKGKTTTTSLLYQVLKDQGKDAYLLGNMGNPPLDVIEEMTENSILTVEMAAHHLEFLKRAPQIGCILNLFEEHLDAFGTAENYYQAKLNMFRKQDSNAIGFYYADNETLCTYVNTLPLNLKLYSISSEQEDTDIYFKAGLVYEKENKQILYHDTGIRHLLGSHNLIDIMFVSAVAHFLQLDMEQTEKSIDHFMPLEHRMELVGTYQGITFYNDSIATIPTATMGCIEAIPNAETLIFGGKDRGIDYTKFIEDLEQSRIEHFICMPDTGTKIGKEIKGKDVHFVNTLEEAVQVAYQVTGSNKSCILSPAASSYNQFKNFEEKGTTYKKLVREYELGNEK